MSRTFGKNLASTVTGLVFDSAGLIAIAGYTQADPSGYPVGSSFPASATSPLQTFQGSSDSFVLRVSRTGELMAGSLFGGTGADRVNSLSLDAAGNAYLSGWTDSPSIPAANRLLYTAATEAKTAAFVTKLSPLEL